MTALLDAEPACRIRPPASDADLERALDQPYRIFIEDGAAPASAPDPAALLVLVVTTATAYALPVAEQFVIALAHRYDPVARRSRDLVLALFEAIANAISHGNMGLDSSLRSTIGGLQIFYELLETRLTDPLRAGLAISIEAIAADGALTIRVSDQGSGFDPVGGVASPAASYGRGLRIIRSVSERMEWKQETKTLEMSFKLGGC